MDHGIIQHYFSNLDSLAAERFERLAGLYAYWNARINVISRKDLPNLYTNHILHSLSLAKVIPFREGEMVLDIGTGGGLPGIPLAVMNPGVHFTLVDSIKKKVLVVENIARELGLGNVTPLNARVEDISGSFHYIVSRAVGKFPELAGLSANKLADDPGPAHGIYSLKGGNLDNELGPWKKRVKITSIDTLFTEEYFKTKKIVFLPATLCKV